MSQETFTRDFNSVVYDEKVGALSKVWIFRFEEAFCFSKYFAKLRDYYWWLFVNLWLFKHEAIRYIIKYFYLSTIL